jgi:predicted PurR-regulated permease PerM
MRTRIDIDTRTFVRFWLVPFGLALAALLITKAQIALIILGVSLFLALALNGPVSLISRKLPGKSRVGATAIAYVAVIVLLGLVIFLVIPPIVQQTAKFAQTFPSVVDNTTKNWSQLRHVLEQYNLQGQLDSALTSIKDSAGGWAGDIGKTVVNGIGSFFSFFAGMILVIVLTFLMLIEGPEWMNRIWRLYANKQKMERHRHIIGRMYNVVSGYVTGQLTVSAIGATCAGLFIFIISFIFPAVDPGLAMPTAAITFVLSLIPMFGATIGGVIITLLLALNSVPAAVIYAIYFVVYQQIENNFVSPHIQSKRIDLSALMVLAAVTIGLYMFGVVGGIIAIPIAGSIRVLVEEYLKDQKTDQPEVKKIDPKVTLVSSKKK